MEKRETSGRITLTNVLGSSVENLQNPEALQLEKLLSKYNNKANIYWNIYQSQQIG